MMVLVFQINLKKKYLNHSHDLGTILTRIKLGLELINEEKQTKPIKKDIKTKKDKFIV